MKRPKMILFDYGHTLVNETGIDVFAGHAAVLSHAVKNPDGVTPQILEDYYQKWHTPMNEIVVGAEYEIPALLYDRAIYDSLGLEFDCSYEQLEIELWNASIPYVAMPGAGEMLRELKSMGIRTGVISNLSFCEASLKKRIYGVIPDATFEFFIASSSYGFRKPHPSLFAIACRRANLSPEDMFFCGDNTRADAYGAYCAGMTPIWYAPDIPCFYRPKELDVTPEFSHICIRHWSQLTELVRGLEE